MMYPQTADLFIYLFKCKDFNPLSEDKSMQGYKNLDLLA